MIWSWIIGSRLGRAFGGIGIALGLLWAVIAQQRRDARNNALRDARQRDRDNADSIRDRVRGVDDSLHKHSERGFRD